MKKIVSVVGARPNFMKVAPFIHALKEHNIQQKDKSKIIQHILVHTGQHYDDRMSKAFFTSLNIPEADVNLGIGSGTHAEQVGYTMIAIEKVIREEKPDCIVVYGDVNATCACAVTAKKEGVKLVHVEAGLRSKDMSMPEEINRLVTDKLSDLLLTPDKLSNKNLIDEGTSEEKIKFVGNIMIDTLEREREKAMGLDNNDIVNRNLLDGCVIDEIESDKFAIITIHRPSNVDERSILASIVDFLISDVVAKMKLVWPIHPRTKKQLEVFGLWDKVVATKGLIILYPLGYHDLLKLNSCARIMLTDSGGLQEECTVLGTPCLTLRWNTERPVTLREHGGASVLVGNNVDNIRREYEGTLAQFRKPDRPELWDGNTAKRIVNEIVSFI